MAGDVKIAWLVCVGIVGGMGASPAWAEPARFAVQPLEAREFSSADQSTLQQLFEVAVTRVPKIALARHDQVKEALARPELRSCGSENGCLQKLAESTQSLYAVTSRICFDAVSKELNVTARVVRANGEVVRKVSLNAPVLAELGLAETASELLTVLVSTLDLGRLSGPPPAALQAELNAPAAAGARPLAAAKASLLRRAGFKQQPVSAARSRH